MSCTLIPASASARNIFSPTPVWVRSPMPTTDSLAMSSSKLNSAPGQLLEDLAEQEQALFQIGSRNGERKAGAAAVADVLHDHVDHHAPFGDGGEDFGRDAGNIGQMADRHARLGRVEADFADDDVFHRRQLGDDFALEIGSACRLRRTAEIGCADRRGRGVRLVQAESRRARPARPLSQWSRLTSVEILISLVVIIPMLMPASASDRNIWAATPGVRSHSQADDGELRDIGSVLDAAGPQVRRPPAGPPSTCRPDRPAAR